MALNFSAFTGETTQKPRTTLNLSAFGTPKTDSKTVNFPEFLGGGSFIQTKTGELQQEKRGYAGIEAPGEYREHIFPVALGGKSNIDNIKVYGKDKGQEKSNYENQIIRQYKAGELDLPEARALVLKKFRELTGLSPTEKEQTMLGQLWSSVKDMFPQTKQTAEDIPETLKATPVSSIKSVPEFAKAIYDAEVNAVQKLDKLFNTKGTVSQKIGQTLEATAGSVGVVLSPITAAFEASKEIPVLGTLSSLITLPLAVAGDAVSNIVDEGLDALKETGAVNETVIENIRDGVKEVSVLATQIVVGGKMFKGKERKAKVEELKKKYGEKDAETIMKTAEQRAKVEMEVKPDLNTKAFKPRAKEVIEKLDIKAKSEKLGDPVLQVGDNKVVIKLPKNLTETQRAKLYDEVGTIKDFSKQPIHISQKRILDTAEGRKLEVLNLTQASKQFPEVKRLVKDMGLDIVEGRVQQPIRYEPLKEPQVRPAGNAVSSVAKSIETKAIEKGLVEGGFDSLASFERTTMKDQARIAKDTIKDINYAREVVRGEKPLPEGLNGISLVKAMEEVVKKTKDGELAYELANSPLTQQVSLAAQELSLTRGRTPDSATAQVARVKKAREKKAGKATEKKSKIKKDIKKETEKVNLKKEDLKWDKFLDSIKC